MRQLHAVGGGGYSGPTRVTSDAPGLLDEIGSAVGRLFGPSETLSARIPAASQAPNVVGPNTAPKTVIISRTKYPDAAKHIEQAQKAGRPSVLTVDRAGGAQRRREALRGIPVKPRRDRDEYPGAMFKEGGAKASVEHTGIYDNRGSGRCMRAQCADVPDGSQIQITIRP
jgi:hypothetical protein